MGILTENVSCTCCTEMVDSRKDGFFPKKDFLYKGWLTVKILMIEDDLGLNRGISFALAQEGYEVVTAENMEKGLKLFEMEHPDAILLDLNLPDGDGIQLCQKIRERSDLPVLMLTARDMEVDEIMGLKCGADDYMTKPFSPSELVARVKAHLARYDRLVGNGKKENDVVEIRGIKIDKTARRVWVNGEEKQFTTKEFDLLTFLAENPNRVFTKEELFREIWDMESIGDIATVTVHIKKIREKIEFNTAKPQYIETIWGVGYRFKA